MEPHATILIKEQQNEAGGVPREKRNRTVKPRSRTGQGGKEKKHDQEG
jgi:hypothetical protein